MEWIYLSDALSRYNVTSLTQTNCRNELLTNAYAPIDTEYRFDSNNQAKPYTLFAAAIVDN